MVPLVHVVVASRSGSAADPRHREGLTNLAAEWARRGAGGKSREEIDTALDALGATLDVSTFVDSTRFEGEVLTRNLDAYLALMADILVRPTFSAAELDRTRSEVIGQIDELRTDDRALAGRFFARNLYADHPYGHPPDGHRVRAGGVAARRGQRALSAPLRGQEPGVRVLRRRRRRTRSPPRSSARSGGCPPRRRRSPTRWSCASPSRRRAGASSWSTSPIGSKRSFCSATRPCARTIRTSCRSRSG